MQRYAIIDTATNSLLTVVEYEEAPSTPPPGFAPGIIAVQHDRVSGNWTWDGSALIEPPTPAPMPVPLANISDRQFFQQLAIQGVITQQEALDAVKTGTVPAALAKLVAALPADQQFSANMLLAGATTFQRSHPLTIEIGDAYGWDSSEMDMFWRAASAL